MLKGVSNVPKTMTPAENVVMISLRLPTDLIKWLQSSAVAEGQNRTRRARELIEDAYTWFGLPEAMAEAFKADAKARGIPTTSGPHDYVRELLTERFLQIAANQAPGGKKK
jgi:hypothetical protein